jgi:ribose transport system substrate-binding protein
MARTRIVTRIVAGTAFLALAACSAPPGAGGDTRTSADPGSKIDAAQLNTALGPVPKPKGPTKLAYVSKTLINEYWQCAKAGAEQAAKEYGVSLDTQAAKDESSLSEQLDIAQTMMTRKYDALLASPESDSNLGPAVDQAKAENMPVVDITDARMDKANAYVGPDAVHVGELAAEYIAKQLPDGGEVAQIEGQAGSPNARNRMQGFQQGVKANAKLKLVASQPGNWDRLTALNVAVSIMRAHPDLKAIYANNDVMALGVAEAVKDVGKQGQILVVGTDGISQARQAVASGSMAATVGWSCTDDGRRGVETALRLLAGQKVPAWVVSPVTVITRENATQSN